MLTTRVLLTHTLLAFSICLAGCTAMNPHNYTPQEKSRHPDDTGAIKTVLKGDTVIHHQIEIVSDMLFVPEDVACGGGIFVPSAIHSGSYLKTGEASGSAYFSPVSTDGQKTVAGEYQLDSIRYRLEDGSLSVLGSGGGYLPCSHPIGAEVKRNQKILREMKPSQRRSIAYNGSDGQLLSFTCRERNASLNITHSMDDGKIFSRNGAKIEIISYNKRSLTCRVLHSFDLDLRVGEGNPF